MKHIYPVLSDLEDVYRLTSSPATIHVQTSPFLSLVPPLFRFILNRGLTKVGTLSIGCLRIVGLRIRPVEIWKINRSSLIILFVKVSLFPFFFFAISFFCKNPRLITSNYMIKCRMLLRLLSYNSDYLIIRRYMIKIICNFTIKLRNEAREIIIF